MGDNTISSNSVSWREKKELSEQVMGGYPSEPIENQGTKDRVMWETVCRCLRSMAAAIEKAKLGK